MMSVLHILNIVWPYLAAGGCITVLTQVLKRIAKLEKEGVIRLLFHTVTVITTATIYLLSNHGISYGLLMLHGAGFSGVANALYPAVKWFDDKLVKIQKALKYVDQELPALETAIDDSARVSAALSEAAEKGVSQTVGPRTPPPAAF